MAEDQKLEDPKKTQYRRVFFTMDKKPIAYAETLYRLLEFEYGKPKEAISNGRSQLIYDHEGTTIVFEVAHVGVTNKGLEVKVDIRFRSDHRQNIEEVTSRRVWDLFDLRKTDIVLMY